MKIISGGQTGVDTAALDFAIQRGLSYGGWVPKGRTNEAGLIPARYQSLFEASSSNPNERTRLNVSSSDATLILTDGSESPGTLYTHQVAKELGKAVIRVVISADTKAQQVQVRKWVATINPTVLNIAGPRESEASGVHAKTLAFLDGAMPSPSGEM